MITQRALYGYDGAFALPVPPIAAYLKGGGGCLAAFLHFHDEEVHAQHLKLSAGGEYGEILLLLQLALQGVLHLQACLAVWARAGTGSAVRLPCMSAVHAGGASFG